MLDRNGNCFGILDMRTIQSIRSICRTIFIFYSILTILYRKIENCRESCLESLTPWLSSYIWHRFVNVAEEIPAFKRQCLKKWKQCKPSLTYRVWRIPSFSLTLKNSNPTFRIPYWYLLICMHWKTFSFLQHFLAA